MAQAFKNGREDVQDESGSGQSRTQMRDANVDRIRTFMRSDRKLGVRLIAEEFTMNREIMTRNVSFLNKKSITKMEHPSYSPHLVPCNFWLFPKFKKKNALKGQTLGDIADIQCNVMLWRGIPEDDSQDCFQQWHRRLTKCTASQGDFQATNCEVLQAKRVLLKTVGWKASTKVDGSKSDIRPIL
jgi:hypothetical protein